MLPRYGSKPGIALPSNVTMLLVSPTIKCGPLPPVLRLVQWQPFDLPALTYISFISIAKIVTSVETKTAGPCPIYSVFAVSLWSPPDGRKPAITLVPWQLFFFAALSRQPETIKS